jgi:hypothetical protein
MDDVPYTVYSPQTNQLLDLYTDTNHRQPAAPSINNHAPLESAINLAWRALLQK